MAITASVPVRPIQLAIIDRATRLFPGIALCLLVTLAAAMLQEIERRLLGAAWLESLVLAILVGATIRTCWTPHARFHDGIHFSAHTLLEVAVVLLGASVSATTVLKAGPGLLFGIAAVVLLAIVASYGIGRLLRLSHRMALLVACGNSICGNSAIAAVAPIIGADGKDVAASIAFTAVFGVILVLGLPLAVPLLHLSGLQYGALAGLTVYAVPQVLAATAPIGAVAVQIGTLVKLVRVLMLGPVVLCLSLLTHRLDRPFGNSRPAQKLPIHTLVPWFILGFLGLAAARSCGLVPTALLHPVASLATMLTVISMAALGLGTDLRLAARAGGRVTCTVVLSLLILGGISYGLIRLLGLT
ncbi:YeiH family protein [Lichenicola sp.]|uniref:YeiH family protein n=1 Tax=Lichenicola sp. TaxID=2804529 RepID=UPI003B008E92